MRQYLAFSTICLALCLTSCKSTLTNPPAETLPGTDSHGNVTLPVPPADSGIQIVFGPFAVPQGQEVQIDHWFKLKTTLPFEVGRIQIATNLGTHHMNLFRTLTPHADSNEYNFSSTAIWNESDLMIESQQHYIDWSLPTGVSVHLNSAEQMCMQVHYVNASTQTTPNDSGKVVINIWKANGPATQPASMLFAQDTAVLIKPHSDTSFSKFCRFAGTTKPLAIYAMTGHFHSRGKSFVVEKWDSVNNASLGEVYRSVAWSEPPFKVFDPPLTLNPGEMIKYTANYHNDSDSTIKFGPHVETQEHCNLFLWFTPGYLGGKTIYDKTN